MKVSSVSGLHFALLPALALRRQSLGGVHTPVLGSSPVVAGPHPAHPGGESSTRPGLPCAGGGSLGYHLPQDMDSRAPVSLEMGTRWPWAEGWGDQAPDRRPGSRARAQGSGFKW